MLTGSANILTLPKISESLAGRLEILTLWPLSQAEIAGSTVNVVDRLFARTFTPLSFPTLSKAELIDLMISGGYPEPLARPTEARRRAWFSSYLMSILQRDVRDLSNISGLTDMPRLLTILVSRMASLMNSADISRSSGIPYTTLSRYLTVLDSIYLIQMLPAWSSNVGVRLTKSPKVIVNDTGLAANLLGIDRERLKSDESLTGNLFENFVAMELIKAVGTSVVGPSPFHYRTAASADVDLVLEAADGRLVAVEVKSSSSVTWSDFRGIRQLQDIVGLRFLRGIVFYSGTDPIPFGDNLLALPISALWGS